MMYVARSIRPHLDCLMLTLCTFKLMSLHKTCFIGSKSKLKRKRKKKKIEILIINCSDTDTLALLLTIILLSF